MRAVSIALYVAVFCSGLFTGLLWTFMVGVDPMQAMLDASSYAQMQQMLIGTIDRGIPPVLIAGLVAPLVVLVGLRRQPRSRVFLFTLAGFVLYLFIMIYTIVLNVPINNYVLSWDVAAPPADWANARDRWDQLNTPRTFVAFAWFMCHIVALTSPLPQPSAVRAPVQQPA